MALSDACHEFLEEIRRASAELAERAHQYSSPDYARMYGHEVDVVRRLAAQVAETPNFSIELLVEIVMQVQQYLDAPPDSDDMRHHRRLMLNLMRIFYSDLDAKDAAEATALAEIVINEKTATPRVIERFKAVLGKLGKSSYEVAVKIVGDVASATVKKMLGI